MLLSTRITIIIVCTIFALMLLAATQSTHLRFAPYSRNSSFVPYNISVPQPTLNPFWTTEQLVPKFAYVQYATDLDYLCNTVSDDASNTGGMMRLTC